MPKHVMGLDIGSSGALALLTVAGELLAIEDMPTLDDGPKGRPAVNAALLAQMVRSRAPAQAFVEYIGARPGEAAAKSKDKPDAK